MQRLPELSQMVAALETEVGRAETALVRLKRQIRANAVEADAARNPAQFRDASFARQSWPRAVAAVVGLPAGLAVGGILSLILTELLEVLFR